MPFYVVDNCKKVQRGCDNSDQCCSKLCVEHKCCNPKDAICIENDECCSGLCSKERRCKRYTGDRSFHIMILCLYMSYFLNLSSL